MGRLPIILGLLFLVVGAGGAAVSSWRVPTSPAATAFRDLCRPGERLVDEDGTSISIPGQQPGRSMRMFCIDDRETRRDVTGDFFVSMSDHAGEMMGHLAPVLYGIVFSLVAALGLLLILLGLLARRRGTSMPAVAVQPGSAQPAAGDLADRLRQLADARAANLISQAEHDRLRSEALQAMRTKS